MKGWFQVISLLLLAVLCNSENTTFEANRTLLSLSYQYSINLNVSEAIPSIDAAINLLHNETLTAIDQLVEDGDDPLFLVVDLADTFQVRDYCQSSTDVCASVESAAMLSLRANVEERLVEFAGLEEVESLFESFNSDHDNILVSFFGPFVVRADISILLEGVNGKMSQVEIGIFEEVFINIIGPPLLNSDPSIVLRSATVFLQQVMDQNQVRRLQAGNDNNDLVIRVHVSGQCNQCSDSDFTRLVGEAVNIRRPDLKRELQNKGQESSTDYFDDVTVRITVMDQAPGISECCLDFYPQPEPFPYWVLLVTGACVLVIIAAGCCAACRSKREGSKQQEQGRAMNYPSLVQTSTEDVSEGGAPSASDESKKRGMKFMPHLRLATQQRLAARENASRGEARASSLTF